MLRHHWWSETFELLFLFIYDIDVDDLILDQTVHSVNPGGHARKFSVGLFRAFLKVQMSSPECNYVSYEVPSHRGAHQAP